MSYQYIINPNTGRKNKITSKQGKSILFNYLSLLKGGSNVDDLEARLNALRGNSSNPPPPPPSTPPPPPTDDLEERLNALMNAQHTQAFVPEPLPDDDKIAELERDRREKKALVDTLTASYKAKYPGGPDVRNPDSVGDDYHAQRLAVHNLMMIEEEIKDVIQRHTDYTDEDIFECLDEHDFNIKEAIQCLEEL